MKTTPDSRTAAHQFLDQGLHVFPLDHPGHRNCAGLHGKSNPCDGTRGKHPCVAFGTWAVTVTHKQLDLQWEKRRGLANIGVACGPSNLVILDEDAPGELDRWADAYGITLPETYAVATGRENGGRHLYYAWDHTEQPISNTAKAMDGFKIDVRGKGGYVVAEHSQHQSGAIYTGNGLPIAPLPPEVAALLLAGKSKPDNNDDGTSSGAHRQTFWETVTDSENPNTAMIGWRKRHKALVRYACRLRDKGLDYQEALHLYRQRWLLCVQPTGQIDEARYHETPPPDCNYPVTWDEAEAKLRDVYKRYPAGQPEAEKTTEGTQQARPAVSLIPLAEVKPERVEWLWHGRIPRGKLVTLDGDPGLGKSTLAVDFAGPVTTGGPWPDGTRCVHPGAVLLLSAEDGLADTVRPRLDAAGADVTKVHAIEGVPVVDNEGFVGLRPPTLGDIAALREAIITTGAVLLIVDVLMAYLPTGSDAHKDQDVRAVLGRLTKLAEETGCTVILIRHLNKSTGRDPLYRGGGSIGIVGAGRVALLVAADPDDDERRVLAGMKSNLGPLPEALAYRLVSSGDYGVARVQWEGHVDHTAHSLLGERLGAQEATAATEAQNWLEDYLTQHGSARSADVKREAAKQKISERTVQRAAEKLHIVTRSEGFPRVTWWALPSDANDRESTPDTQNLGATGATGTDQHKQFGATGPKMQSRQGLCDGATVPPGGITDRTPGMTAAVERALAGARNGARFLADPPCFYCDKPVSSKTQDKAGRYAHLGCQADTDTGTLL